MDRVTKEENTAKISAAVSKTFKSNLLIALQSCNKKQPVRLIIIVASLRLIEDSIKQAVAQACTERFLLRAYKLPAKQVKTIAG